MITQVIAGGLVPPWNHPLLSCRRHPSSSTSTDILQRDQNPSTLSLNPTKLRPNAEKTCAFCLTATAEERKFPVGVSSRPTRKHDRCKNRFFEFMWRIGNLPVEEVPQIVLLTFDDAVNDLNKQYYIELFESGRLNPNGCPISATFYVSHEWTDYSQVQNLYADGHEMASHTVS